MLSSPVSCRALTQAACQWAPGGTPTRPVTPPPRQALWAAPQPAASAGCAPGLGGQLPRGPPRGCTWAGGGCPSGWKVLLSVRACSGGSVYWALRVIKTQLGLKRPLYLLTRTFVKKTKLLSHAVYTLVEMIPIVYPIALGFSKLSMYLSVSFQCLHFSM